jgi:Protein of unknown function (DUF402)
MRSSGDPALLRYVHDGRVSRIVPATVVEDGAQGVGLYVRDGTRIRVRARPDGAPVERSLPYAERFTGEWKLGDAVWEGNHTLVLAPAGAAHAFIAFWIEDWEFQGWYVNLQEPLRPSPFGWDTADNVLDLVVAPDLSSWRWKDEDELREAVRLGRFTEEQAAELYAEGERALATVERRAWPFDREWADWRPDPGWPIPGLDPAAEEA